MRLDLWIIGLYMAATMWIGWRVSDQSRDVEGYTVGNRNMSGWPLGMSVLGAFLSSITFLALPANVYNGGNWAPILFGAMAPVAAWIATVWLVPLYRERTRLSAYELLETRFGYWARAYAGLSFVVLQIVRVGMVQLLVGLACEPMLNWHDVPAGLAERGWSEAEWVAAKVIGLIVMAGVVVIIYDVVGGIRAVVWTDIVQVGVLTLGAIWILAELTIARQPDGLSSFIRDLPTERMSLGPWFNWQDGVWNWAMPTVFIMAIYGITENLRNYGADQQYVQRMLAARDSREAKRAIWLGALGYQPLNLIFCLIGTALWLHVHDLQVSKPDSVLLTVTPERVLPTFIRNELPEAVAGLVIAAILAAAMSTTDSSMNSSSMVVYYDLVKRMRRGPGLLREIIELRLWTIAVGMAGTAMSVALYVAFGEQRARSLMEVWWGYAGVAGGGMFGLFILAWTMPRLPGWIAAIGVAASLPLLAWGTLLRNVKPDSALAGIAEYQCTLHPNLVGPLATTLIVAIGVVGIAGVRLGVIRGRATN